MIAGKDNGRALQIKFPEQATNEAREDWQHSSRCVAILRVADLVGDEVFVKREAIRTGDTGQHFAGFFRCAQINTLAALYQPRDQQLVREIVKDCRAGSQVFDLIEAQAGGFDGSVGCGNPTRPALEKSFRVGVGESYRTDSRALELNEQRMLANDIQ